MCITRNFSYTTDDGGYMWLYRNDYKEIQSIQTEDTIAD